MRLHPNTGLVAYDDQNLAREVAWFGQRRLFQRCGTSACDRVLAGDGQPDTVLQPRLGSNAIRAGELAWHTRLDENGTPTVRLSNGTVMTGFEGAVAAKADVSVILDVTKTKGTIVEGTATRPIRLPAGVFKDACWLDETGTWLIASCGPEPTLALVHVPTGEIFAPTCLTPKNHYTPACFATGPKVSDVWVIYQSEFGLVTHPATDPTKRLELAPPGSPIYAVDACVIDNALAVAWASDPAESKAGERRNTPISILALQALPSVPVPVPVPDRPVGPESQPLPDGTEVDLTPYFTINPSLWPRGVIAEGDRHGLNAKRIPALERNGDYCLWFHKFGETGPSSGAKGELLSIDAAPNGYIRLRADCSNRTPIDTWTDDRWLFKRMKIGRQYALVTGDHELIKRDRDNACAVTERRLFTKEMWLHKVWPKYYCGKSLGVRSVALYVYNNTGVRPGQSTTNPGLNLELYWVILDAAWGGWDTFPAKNVFSTGQFVLPSDVPRTQFLRIGGPDYAPDVPVSCIPPATGSPDVPPIEPPATGLKKPEVTVTNWTLNEMKNGREFAFEDRENPGFKVRVWTENWSMYASITNPAGTGRTGLARRITECSSVEPVPPSGMTLAQATALVNAAYRELLFRAPDPIGLESYTSRLMDGRLTDATMRAEIMASAEYKALHPTPIPIPPGGATPDMHAWPKFGGSYATGPWRRDYDPALFAALNRDAFGDLTRYWLLDAWGVAPNGPGQHPGIQPWQRDAAGVFDLNVPNPEWDDRLNRCVTIQNRAGATVQLSVLNLYSWSTRTEGRQWVPDPNLGPFRRNRNGVKWDDDSTFDRLPDWVVEQLLTRMCVAVKGLAVTIEVAGNEFPQKETHVAMASFLQQKCFTPDWQPDITCNRNEDTPGQYFNMKVGKGQFYGIAYHGKDRLSYLDDVDDDEPSSRPNTFRKLFDQSWDEGRVDPKRIIMSSDGCRKNGGLIDDCYEWDVLAEVVRDHLRRGFTYEHQSRIKMRPFLENRLALTDFEGDWLRSVRG